MSSGFVHSTRQKLEAIFNAALEFETPEQRGNYLDRACAGDPELRRHLDEFLAAQDEANAFFKELPDLAAARTEVSIMLTGKPGDRIGRYKLLQQIGEGGCGVVYMAEQEEPVRRRVALKVIKLGMDTKSVIARFEAERQALALMDHPNIAKVHDAGATATGRPYFVMELVRGLPITRYCDEQNVPLVERLRLFIQVCRAIQHAHQKGIIHRDIKPSNILVTLQDGASVPKVIDFGIAKATDQRLTEKTLFTQLDQFIGTPAYMSPEQVEMSGVDIDTRSDIYSLGVLLYELLTGQTPFDGQGLLRSGLDELRRTIREKEPMRPSTRLCHSRRSISSAIANRKPQIANDLDWIVMKCLEKDRARRYETANGLAQDILRHLNHEPVTARPPSQVYRLQKLARRNRVTFAAAAIVAASLVLGAVVSAWQAVRATRATREQSRLRKQAEDQELVARHKAYASDMNLAHSALADSDYNLGLAWSLLDRHRPTGTAVSNQFSVIRNRGGTPASWIGDHRSLTTDLRGWEWRYLWQQCQSEALFTLCQRSNSISSLSVSHDGQWLAVGEFQKSGLSIWNLETRRETVLPLPAGELSVSTVFSPLHSWLAIHFSTGDSLANRRDTVWLWDMAQHRLVKEWSLGGICRGLAFSGDGQSLIAATETDNRITLWRIPEGDFLASHPASVVGTPRDTPFALARDSSLAAHAMTGGRIRVVDLRNGEERWTAKAADENVPALAFSRDGKFLASGSGYAESVVRVWDVASGNEICILTGHRSWVAALLFFPDGKTLASASADQTIRLWDLTDVGRPRLRNTLRGHRLEVWRLALLPDGKTLVSGGKDGSVCFWDTEAPWRDRAHFILPGTVTTWRFAPDSQSVLTVDSHGHVERWWSIDFQQRQTALEMGTPIVGACISDDGVLVAAGSTNGLVQVWNLEQQVRQCVFQAPPGRHLPRAFLAQGKKLVTIHYDSASIYEWDVTTGKQTKSWQSPAQFYSFVPVAFSKDEQWAFTVGFGGVSILRNIAMGHEASRTLTITQPMAATFSPDGRFVAAASGNGFVKLWQTETWREVTSFTGFLPSISSVAFSPDGKRLAAGSIGRDAIKLWDVESKEALLTLPSDKSWFHPTAFSPDGNILGSRSASPIPMLLPGTLHLWRAPSWKEIEAAEKGQR